MPTLAPKLPYTHPFAGGYPRLGGQPLPTDPDAIDYLERVKAADGGAAVEVGVAMAVDAFVKGCKADSAGYAGDPTRTVWDALQASCIMCGARTIAGALVPLRTPYGPELVNIDALPTPTITDAQGSVGVWLAETLEMKSTAVSTSSVHPQFLFAVSGNTDGRRYRVSGRVSGDVDRFKIIRVFGYNIVPEADGTFDEIITSSGSNVRYYLDGTATCSIRIESLSIREDSFTPTAYPQPVNFVSADYDRSSGLKGDGSTKYLDSNRANDADGLADRHMSCYVSSATAVNVAFMGASDTVSTPNSIDQLYWYTPDGLRGYLSSQGGVEFASAILPPSTASFVGASRSTPDSVTARASGSSASAASTATAGVGRPVYVFARNRDGAANSHSDARLAFYSIGSAIPDLAALDNRVTQLVTGIKFHSLAGLVATDYDPDTVAYIVAAYESGGTL